jgi:phenylpropionate dioxygenase-like ring-hydroxylating dioxygenase large terminal subunit
MIGQILLSYCLLYVVDIFTLRINTKPHVSKYKNHLPLFWKIANKNEFPFYKPKRYLFNGYPIAIYKDYNNNITAISDICIHRGASLSHGKVLSNNCLQCPYHGWEYNKGTVQIMPGFSDIKKNSFGVPRFELKDINQDIYIRPTFDINSQKGNIYNHTVYIPPEATDPNFIRVSGVRHIKRPYNLVTENVLDMMHISYVHSFGNSLAPVPFEIEYQDIDELSGRTTFHYTAGPTSMSKIIGGAKYVQVENEFHLPDMTVTRVKANQIIKTIITHCYPVGKNESILHFDLYRNFLTTNLLNPLFEYQMKITLDEDISILNRIYDDYILGFMSNKYDITQMKYREKTRKLLEHFEEK